MNNKKNNLGYTLIEIVVVVASVGMIMTALIGVILGTFRAQNRTKSNNKIMENGTWIINELRKNVFNSSAEDVVCAEDGLSVQIKSLTDGQDITFSCDKVTNQIASVSAARRSVLNSEEVNIIDCEDFVMCEVNGSKVSGIVFNFGIGATTSGVGSTQVFTTRVTLRN